MKKMITGILMMVIVMVMSLPVMAGTLEETMVKSKVSEYESDIYEELADEDTSEGLRRAVSPSVKAFHMGNDLYDIVISYRVYKNNLYEFHIIYDPVEDEELLEYGIYKGKRYTWDELNEQIEKNHPEFCR